MAAGRALLASALLTQLAAAGGHAPSRPGAGDTDGDIMQNIHFSSGLRRGQLAMLPREPHLDLRDHRNWASATQTLKKNEEQIYEDLPRFIHSSSNCPFPVYGNAIDVDEEFWAFGDSFVVSGVDTQIGHTGHTQLGRVQTSFWRWGSHWMRIEREWRDPSGESIIASSRGGAQSWYHNTVDIYDCEGEMLAYLKFKLGSNAHQDYTRITVHDLAGNEVAVAFTPRQGEDGSDWRHRRMVVHDRNSGMKMVELDQRDSGEDWRIAFQKGSEVLGGLGSDPRVIVMLLASRDAASQFAIWSIPMWPFVVALFLLLFFCIWCNLANIKRLYGYKQITELPQIGADASSWWGDSDTWGGHKQKVDELQPDGDVPASTGGASRGGDAARR